MNASPTIPAELLASWNASYLAAAKSPILAALRLAAADVDALARVVATRCVVKTVGSRACCADTRHGAGRRRRRSA
jgi:hypothetical protein